MDQIKFIILISVFLIGCATAQKPVDPVGQQIDAAKKVVGALSPSTGSAEKYSPVTGKHYSSALEYEPGTGVKLISVEE